MNDAQIVATGPVDAIVKEILRPFGRIIIAPDTSESALMAIMPEALALVVRGVTPISGRVIDSGRRLRVIGRTGVGYSNVDIAAATARRIPVIYTPGATDRAVAEAAMALMLALTKQLNYWDQQLKAGNWQSRFDSRSGDLDGATLGIIGFGRIGQTLAQLARPFNMTLLAHDPFASPNRARELGATLVGIDDLLRQSDFISIHAALTGQTHGLINSARLAQVKRGAYLVNLARGELVEGLDVLQAALTDGRLAGVGLDVFAPEPPDVTHPIFRMPNCLTAPHALAGTRGAMAKVFTSMAQDMAAVLAGQRPRHVVNPEVFA